MRFARLLPVMVLAAGVASAVAADGESAARPCARTLAQLRTLTGDAAFPLRWIETTMGDGKPLVVTIRESGGLLSLEFVKTGEGPWAEGLAAICSAPQRPGGLDRWEARMAPGSFRMGQAAHWLLRAGSRRIDAVPLEQAAHGRLKISLQGWSGEFSRAVD